MLRVPAQVAQRTRTPYVPMRTPTTITKPLVGLAANLAPGSTPLYLFVQPESGAQTNACFHNVAAKVQQDGGAIVHGWLLWEWPNVLAEAEFHAVWQTPDGNLIDITPRPDGEERVLFVRDESRRYRGVLVDNVRVALRDDPLIHHFIGISAHIVKIVSRGQGLPQAGHISVPADKIERLLMLYDLTVAMLRKGLRAHDDCLCGSGKKYKRCHGKLLP